MEFITLLKTMVAHDSSDLHIRVGCIPVFRIYGSLHKPQMGPISATEMEEWIASLLNEKQIAQFDKEHDIDIGVGFAGIGRVRINVYKQRGTSAMAIRLIKTTIPKFTQLGFPDAILNIASKTRGLILVTGTTGSGKSTLLASMVDYINDVKSVNIITIEDPIEFLFKDKKSIVVQRQIGSDTDSYSHAIHGCFRQDPDVIMIGEIRDCATMEIALSASDTGHLVMSTLHTMNAMETITRIVSFFPPHQHEQIRLILSNVLVAIISLRLLPTKDNKNRVPAVEILINNAAISEYILDQTQIKRIPEAIASGHSQYGSQTFDQSLYLLYKKELISFQTAMQYASNPDDFEIKVSGGVSSTSDKKWLEPE